MYCREVSLRNKFGFLRFVTVSAIVLLLSGCTTAGDAAIGKSPSAAAFSGEVPAFTGPWAAAFTQAYKSTSDGLSHRILSKGAITDADYAEVSSVFVKCMKDKGVTATVDGPAGEASTSDTPNVMEAMNVCDAIFGVVAGLHGQIVRNPQNLDENLIVAACLVRVGLVPASYTANSYAEELKTQKFSYDIDSPKFSGCTRSPLAGVKTDAAPK
jgi:hypothetical protein